MNYDERRQVRMLSQKEADMFVLENNLNGVRQKLLKAMSVLEKHQSTLQKKEGKDQETGATLERIEKKQAHIDKLNERIEAMSRKMEAMRAEVKRLLSFQPVEDQLDALPEGFMQAKGPEWGKLMSSRFKTFQDIFTPPSARVLPSSRRGMRRDDYDKLPLAACPVDPERIPDWLIKELGIAELEGVSDFEKMELKVQAIPEIRRLFESTEPLKDHKGRKSYRLLEVTGNSEEQDGKLIVPYYIARNGKPHRKGMQMYSSVYEAHRRTLHIDLGYGVESAKLHNMRARIKDVQAELIGMKNDDPGKPELEKQLASEVELLHFVTNNYKAQAHDILADVKDIKDKLGRHNPGATCARLVRSLNLLDERLPEIFEKSKFVASDKALLNARVGRDKEKMDYAYRGFLRLCRDLQAGGDTASADRRLSRLPDFGELTLRPFRQYADKLTDKAGAIRDGIEAKDHEFVRDQAINGYVAAKTFECQHERERILRDIAESPIQTTIEQLLSRSRRLYEVVMSKETFPRIRTGNNAAYDEVAGKLLILVERLEHYHQKKMSEAERLAMYERLKAYLESIDFTKVLEKL